MLWYMTSKVSKAAGIKTFFYYGTDIHYQRVRSSVYQTLFPDKGQFAFHNMNLRTTVDKSLQMFAKNSFPMAFTTIFPPIVLVWKSINSGSRLWSVYAKIKVCKRMYFSTTKKNFLIYNTLRSSCVRAYSKNAEKSLCFILHITAFKLCNGMLNV